MNSNFEKLKTRVRFVRMIKRSWPIIVTLMILGLAFMATPSVLADRLQQTVPIPTATPIDTAVPTITPTNTRCPGNRHPGATAGNQYTCSAHEYTCAINQHSGAWCNCSAHQYTGAAHSDEYTRGAHQYTNSPPGPGDPGAADLYHVIRHGCTQGCIAR